MRSDRATGGGRTPEHGSEGPGHVIVAGDLAAVEPAADSQHRALNQPDPGSDAAAVRSLPSAADPLNGGGGADGGSGMQSRAASPRPAADAARTAATPSAPPCSAVSGRP